jgi:hypothetical protein
MRKVISLGIALTIAVSAMAVTATIGTAQVRIVQNGCDTLSFNPPRVHVPFAVINLTSTPVCSIHMIPIPSGPYPPCQIFDCSHPSTWTCYPDSTTGGAQWQALAAAGACIAPFQKLDGFDLVIDPPYCCYRVDYDDGNGNVFYSDTVCFQCESPTATKVETWGALKVLYR